MGYARFASIASIAAFLWFVPADSRGAVEYSVVSLRPPGAVDSAATDINSAGQVVGRYTNSTGNTRIFRYTNGVFQDPGTLGGPNAEAWGINSSGQIVGKSETATDRNTYAHTFVSDGTSITDLQLIGVAFGINDSAKISGFTTQSPRQAVAYSNGSWTPIGTLGGSFAAASKINNNGQIVGTAANSAGKLRAFRHTGTGALIDLGFGDTSEAVDINDAGQIVGYKLFDTGNYAGYSYANGVATPISLSQPFGLNNLGSIVGVRELPLFTYRAAIYRNGASTNLNDLIPADSGWLLREARSINDAGQIVGYGTFGGAQQAFLLTPIPEPCGLALTILCTALLVRRRKPRDRLATILRRAPI